MSKVVVIGAGASGIIASLNANKNNEVILLDSNDKIGKKILLTGNGRCNYWNSDINANNYFCSSNNLDIILNKKDDVFNYLTNLGIYPRIKDNYYYPNSNQAASIVEIFKKEVEKSNIKVIYNCVVTDIEKINDKFIIKTNLEDIECDKVIIASGGCSYPKTGSTGSLFNVLSKYHTVNKLLPGLVPLVTKEKIKDWANIRVDGSVSLYVDNKKEIEEIGEIQLTDYGISGISVFNISSIASRSLNAKKNVYVEINFLKEIEDVYSFLDIRNKKLINHTISEILETVLPYQVINVLLKKSRINKDDNWDNIDSSKKKDLVNLISNFKLEIEDTLDFDRSQVTTGGVLLEEINPNTMESLKVNGLYLVGELLDVDGKCGGFNLAFAFITGYIAGNGV